MGAPRLNRDRWFCLVACLGLLVSVPHARAADNAGGTPRWATRADAAPRKVVVASALVNLTGPLPARLDRIEQLLAEAERQARALAGQPRLDLAVFPEFALGREPGHTAAERAVALDSDAGERVGRLAAQHRTWIVMPMTLREPGTGGRISNAAVLFNRSGSVAGIYRKVHPVLDRPGVWEGGVTQGDAYPVFDCDFGRLGILICWDMSYDAAWSALARAGVEIVALPSASPQTLRPAAAALHHRHYVVTSAPRDNASLFDPIGRTIAQTTASGMLVHQIDLSYAILHWSETLHEGRALSERFGEAVGYDYSSREDTGIFWSNDPRRTIGSMIRELGLREMPEIIEQMEHRAGAE